MATCEDVILTKKKQVLGTLEKVCGTAETLGADNGRARITVGSAAEYDAPREDRDIARASLTPIGTLETTKAVNINFESELNTPDTPVVISGLDVESVLFKSGNIIEYKFNLSPDLSSLRAGDYLRIYKENNTSNNGTFYIVLVNDGSDFVEVINRNRSDNTDDTASVSTGLGDLIKGTDYGPFLEACAQDVNAASGINIGTITSGPFNRNDVITGSPSGATGRVLVEAVDGATRLLYELTSADEFDNGDTISVSGGASATSSATGNAVGLRVTPTSSNFEVVTSRIEEDGFKWENKSAMGNMTINWASSRKAMVGFNMSGPKNAIGTQVLTPSVVQDKEQPPILKNAKLNLDSFAPVFQTAVFDQANTIVLRENGNAAGDSGFETARITGRRPTLTVTLELDLVANYDFYGKFDAGTDIVVKFQTGSVADKTVHFFMDEAEIADIPLSENEGIRTLDLQFLAKEDNNPNREYEIVFV